MVFLVALYSREIKMILDFFCHVLCSHSKHFCVNIQKIEKSLSECMSRRLTDVIERDGGITKH